MTRSVVDESVTSWGTRTTRCQTPATQHPPRSTSFPWADPSIVTADVRDFRPYSLTRPLRYDEGMVSNCPLDAGIQSLEAERGKHRR